MQAAIAACHATATDAAATDWAEIAALYRRADDVRAVAGRRAEPAPSRSRWPKAPRPASRWSTQLDASGTLAGYHLLPATRADLLRRLGRNATKPRSRTDDALALTTTDAERRYLERRLAEVS